ncbi:hypothetical protein EH31_04285 [Erythrobacter longus]|uniref:DUF4336 domain-containing protein n=1 Tax=Erythrobacter longus TaxID=1044 RepID=A0A074MJ60_ERYLO|nr:DUF4336 domain-containing protein [Erythrobacter longus]KEO91898.1 hypothetical protein EH31_04285 [Erythrobacter longus]
MPTALGYRPYEPLLTLKPWGENIWIVDGPEVRYGFGPLQVPCPTRMTVIRLSDGSLFVHSPVELTQGLGKELAQVGPVAHLVAPNQNHFIFLKLWADAYPDAHVFAATGLADRTEVPANTPLTSEVDGPWSTDIDHLRLELGDFTESVFFHRASRTMIVTDLMMNYEAKRIQNPFMRLFLKLGGAAGPHGQPSIDMRFALRPYSEALKSGLEAMLLLEPEALILAHGACYPENAAQEIRLAFPDFV